MSTVAVGPPRKIFFPDEFQPTADHVICGRGKKSYGHIGNQQFLQIVASRINEYAKADTKQSKSEIVQAIVREIDEKGGFIRQDEASGKYYRAEDGAGREKTSQALRDCLKHKYKSSKDIKKTNRKAKRLARQHSKERVGRRGSMGSTHSAYSASANSYTPAHATSAPNIHTHGGPPVGTVVASPVQLKGFDPSALGKSRRQRRNSMGATCMPPVTPSWDTSQYEPTPIMTNVQQRRSSGGGVGYVNQGMPSPGYVQPTPVAAAMDYGPPNQFNSPNFGARSARGVSRRASASSYFDTTLQQPAIFGVGMNKMPGNIDRTMDVSQLSVDNSNPNLGYNVDSSARGYNNNNSDLGYGDQNEDLGYNTVEVQVKLPGAGEFYNRRRTSASSNASSYWSGHDSHSTASNYWNGSKQGNDSGAWDGVDHGDDDSWAEALDLNLLGDLTTDLDALQVVSGGMNINPAAVGEATTALTPDQQQILQLQQQQMQQLQQQQMQEQKLTAENLAIVNPSPGGQMNPGSNSQRRASGSSGSHASGYWQGEGGDPQDGQYHGRNGSVPRSPAGHIQQEPVLSSVPPPPNNNNQSNAMGFYPVDGQQLQRQQMMQMQQQMQEQQLKLRQMQEQMEKQMQQMQQQQQHQQGQNNQPMQQIFD